MYQELLKTTTNSLCVCAHLANKADSDSDSEEQRSTSQTQVRALQQRGLQRALQLDGEKGPK